MKALAYLLLAAAAATSGCAGQPPVDQPIPRWRAILGYLIFFPGAVIGFIAKTK